MKTLDLLPLNDKTWIYCTRFSAPSIDDPVRIEEPCDRLVVVLDGVAIGDSGLNYHATAGDVLFMPRESSHFSRTKKETPLRCFKLSFNWSNRPADLPILVRDEHGLIRQLAQRLFSTWWSDLPRPACIGLLQGILGEYVMLAKESRPTVAEQVREYTLSRLDTHITLDELAAHFGYNPSYFVRRFSKQVGHGPMTEVRLARLGYAKRLVMDTDLSVQAIAECLGMRDPAHLSRLFRRHFRMTIRELRNESMDRRA